MRPFRRMASLLATSLFALSSLALHAQETCIVTTGPYLVYDYAIQPSPYQNQPFSILAQVCPVDGSSQPVQFSVIGSSGYVYQNQVSTDPTTGIATATVSAGLPKGAYDLIMSLPNSSDPSTSLDGYIFVGGPNVAAFSGQFSFLFQGITTAAIPPGAPVQADIAGSFVADGNGNLTGVADINSPFGVLEKTGITGTYSFDDNGRGTLSLTTQLGTQNFFFSVPADQVGVTVYAGTLTTEPGGALIGTGSVSKGEQQPAFPNTPYLATFTGETACDSACQSGGGRPLPITGSALVNLNFGTTFTATVDQTLGTTSQTGITESGTLSALDGNGRAVLTTTASSSGAVRRMAVYLIAKGFQAASGLDGFYLISLDPHDQNAVISGNGTL